MAHDDHILSQDKNGKIRELTGTQAKEAKAKGESVYMVSDQELKNFRKTGNIR